MSLRFCSLGSGSEGNALVVECDGCALMLDLGFSVANTERRLARAGLTPDALDAIVVTHEHSDHLGGVARFARKHRVPVWMTLGTARHADDLLPGDLMHAVDPHEPFAVGAIEVTPFAVPHDASEPVQYVFSDGRSRLGALTDTGCSTSLIEQQLSGCDALVLECNHDLTMLMSGPYAPALKRRVAGKFGHLDNRSAAQLLANLDRSKLKHVIAAHLSKTNNRPALAQAALSEAMGCAPDWIGIAWQDRGFDWREV
jgi:phosphoribosyl 1,2-cyclic phosphodiesterase